MAIVKKDAIKRAAMIDAELGWLRGTALGKLGMLWHTAQEDAGKSTVPKRLLLEWSCVEPEFADKFLELCCKDDDSDGGDYIHFLERRDGGRYFIVGNPEEIERLAKDRAIKSAGGKASAASRKSKTGSAVPQGASNHPHRTEPEQKSEQQFGQLLEQQFGGETEQRAEQKPNPSALALASAFAEASASASAVEEISGGVLSDPAPAPPEPDPPDRLALEPDPKPARRSRALAKPKPLTDGALVWQTYREAYARKYGHEPAPSAKANSMCSQLVQRLGVGDARRVVSFFLTHNKRWYVEKCHMLACCVYDAEALRTQMLANLRVTSTDAADLDRRQSNAQAFEIAAQMLAAEREAANEPG